MVDGFEELLAELCVAWFSCCVDFIVAVQESDPLSAGEVQNSHNRGRNRKRQDNPGTLPLCLSCGI